MGKLVRCSRGSIFDVAVDLRLGSPTLGRWVGATLTEENQRQLWVPVGFAHGFLAVSDVAEVQYKCTNFYTPAAEGAVAWNDSEIGIDWPIQDPIISRRDAQAISLRQYLEKPVFNYQVSGQPEDRL
jgi:dTDP-4-dehydrorhamnose 3,5-epimerase